MSDTFTETTSKSWGSRIVDSIKSVGFGVLLVVLSCIGLFWNEGRAVQTQRSLAEGAGLVVDIDPARVDPANEGKLVHATGDLKAGGPARDPEFGVSAEGLRLIRKVEMYQWEEEKKTETRKNLGGSEETVTTYSYKHTWSDSRIDSGDFKRPDGHQNPQMRYQAASFAAPDVTFGAFRPSERVVRMLPASQQVRVDPALAETLRGKVTGPVQVNDGLFYLGANPQEPRVGDLRISYSLVPAGVTSIIGRQAGTDLADYQTKAGDPLLIVRPGNLSAADMFKAAERENVIITWLIRLVGAVAMLIGFVLVLSPLVVVADVVPLIGSILGAGAFLVSLIATAVIVPIVIAVAWLWYRPLVSIVVLAVGAAIAFGLKKLASRKAAAAAPQPAPAG